MKKVVAVSKPLPKLIKDLACKEQKEPGKVRIVINRQGVIVATTLTDQRDKKEKES